MIGEDLNVMTHAWTSGQLAPAILTGPKKRPAVPSWIRCSRCGTQVCKQGRGPNGVVFFRASAEHEWSESVPPCAGERR